jgi:hypothetical protein
MNELVRFELDDHGSVLVEVDDREPGIERASRDQEFILKASQTMEQALEGVRAAANLTVSKLHELAEQPDEVEVAFGIRLNASAGAVIAKTEAEGHLQVRLTWTKAT